MNENICDMQWRTENWFKRGLMENFEIEFELQRNSETPRKIHRKF